jgi:NAD(P)-dependent dehydrogenase (short-subunit alcohol dehydrogenase family)
MSTTETKGTALITGASAGIGAVYADRLAKRGYDLILVARSRSRLAVLAQRLENETGRSVEPIAADLNDKADLARIETTLRTNASITLLAAQLNAVRRGQGRGDGIERVFRRRHPARSLCSFPLQLQRYSVAQTFCGNTMTLRVPSRNGGTS